MNPDGSRRGPPAHERGRARTSTARWLAPTAETQPRGVARARAHARDRRRPLPRHPRRRGAPAQLRRPAPRASPRSTPGGGCSSTPSAGVGRPISPDFSDRRAAIRRPRPAKRTCASARTTSPRPSAASRCTIEQPFKDTERRPMPATGWSPGRARRLGASALDPISPSCAPTTLIRRLGFVGQSFARALGCPHDRGAGDSDAPRRRLRRRRASSRRWWTTCRIRLPCERPIEDGEWVRFTSAPRRRQHGLRGGRPLPGLAPGGVSTSGPPLAPAVRRAQRDHVRAHAARARRGGGANGTNRPEPARRGARAGARAAPADAPPPPTKAAADERRSAKPRPPKAGVEREPRAAAHRPRRPQTSRACRPTRTPATERRRELPPSSLPPPVASHGQGPSASPAPSPRAAEASAPPPAGAPTASVPAATRAPAQSAEARPPPDSVGARPSPTPSALPPRRAPAARRRRTRPAERSPTRPEKPAASPALRPSRGQPSRESARPSPIPERPAAATRKPARRRHSGGGGERLPRAESGEPPRPGATRAADAAPQPRRDAPGPAASPAGLARRR